MAFKPSKLTNEQISKLFMDMKKTNDPKVIARIRERIAKHCLPMVLRVVQKFHAKTRRRADFDALLSDALFGLQMVMNTFDPTRGTKFTSYSQGRIRGAMVDGLRDSDFLPRLVRQRKRAVDEVVNRHLATEGRGPTRDQLVRTLGRESQKILDDALVPSLSSIDSALNAFEQQGHDTIADRRVKDPDFDLGTRVKLLSLGFSETERVIFIGRFYKDMTMAEIAEALDVSESRVSQVCTSLLQRIKSDQKKVQHLLDAVAA